MSEERPEALLKSALEKIVYFEARSEQLSNDVGTARAELERLRAELSEASQREIGLRRTVAELEVKLSRAHGERDEQARANEALRRERADLLGKLLESAALHDGDMAATESFDLAQFISELRAETLRAREAQAPVRAEAPLAAEASRTAVLAVAPAGAHAVLAAPAMSGQAVVAVAAVGARPAPGGGGYAVERAQELRAQGRLLVSTEQLDALAHQATFRGRTEESLFGFSVRELSAPDAHARQRAAERLKALGQGAAAPALASALHAETDPKAQVAMLEGFASFARHEGVPVVEPLLSSPFADVRVASLKALLSMEPSAAGPHLAAAMKDPDRAVRRRASLLALGLSGDAAVKLGEQAVADAEPEVRALGALVLGASGAERARGILLAALRDPHEKVRKAAAQSLSRLLGQDVGALVGLDDASRRREVRKLAALPLRAAPPPRELAARLERQVPAPPTNDAPALPAAVAAPVRVTEPAVRPQAASVVSPAAPGALEAVCAAVLTELRAAIRGRSLAELEGALGEQQPWVVESCELLVARGHAVRRGQKYFVA